MKTSKKIWTRALLGFPLGVFIAVTITLAVSVGIGDGTYHPVAEQLVLDTGSQLAASIWQYAFSGVFGAVCGALSVVWEMEKWSLLRQTAVHFIGLTACALPLAYYMGWMSRTPGGVASYTLLFLGIYLVLWLALCAALRRDVKRINRKISAMKGRGDP
ncbi:MAG: DUF3021 domain-containing protein [Christensenellales bacterium]|jgi:hypothetical protein